MSNASTASQNARDTAKEVREGMRDARRATSEASGDIQADLQALRDDFGRLAQQVADIFANRGSDALRRARSSMDDIVSGAQDKSREAVGAVRDVSDNFVDAIDESIKSRPYATLALAVGLGFLLGATWRR